MISESVKYRLSVLAVVLFALGLIFNEAIAECPPYDSKDYSYDRDKLLAQYEGRVGALFGQYDNNTYSPEQIDVEHRVARKEAHLSGLCWRGPAVKRAFSNDLMNVTVASRRMNQSKGSKDAAGWLPPENRKHFACAVQCVKAKWSLEIDEAERDVLDRFECSKEDLENACR